MDFKVVYKLVNLATSISGSKLTVFLMKGTRKMRFHLLHTKITLQKR